jgi:glycosyltransferase involved in cell wall biosynthesis
MDTDGEAMSLDVVHITTVHPTFDPRIFHRECHSLAGAGYHVTLLARAECDGQYDGIAVKAISKSTKGSQGPQMALRFRRSFIALRMAVATPARVYHLHDLELIWVGLALKILTHSVIIYDCHEDNLGYIKQKQQVSRLLRLILGNMIWFLEWLAGRYLDCIVTADPGVKRRFEKVRARVDLIYNYPRLDLFPSTLKSDQPQYDLVYHGSLPRYHLEQCFAIDDELVSMGYKVRWLLFGAISDNAWAGAEVARRQAIERFSLEGTVRQELVADKVSAARIGIIPLPDLPKFRHNIPTKLFEFMALSMPVVLSDLPPSRPFVGDGECAILVPPGDAHCYAETIIRLLGSPDLCKTMGKEGRRRIELHYNWEAESQKLIHLYQILLG